MTLKSQPMRLREGGTYTLRFMARGDATVAKATVAGQLGSSVEVPIEPSDEWRAYEATVEMQPGYSTVSFAMGAGGEPDQVLWVDDVQFGRVE